MHDELQAHLDEKVEELVAGGVARNEAVAQARRELGNVADLEERAADVWRWPLVDDLLLDLRHAVRLLGHSPLFTCVAVLTLALGIGANTAIFSVINGVVLAPLPFSRSAELVRVYSTQDGRPFGPSPPDLRDMAAQSRTLSQLVVYDTWEKNVSGMPGAEPEPLRVGLVPAEYFGVLGMSPLRGRLFTAAEQHWGAHHVAIVTTSFWHARYGEDPAILGRSLFINDEPYKIIGVVPDVVPRWMDAQHANVPVFAPFVLAPPPDDDLWAESNRDGRGFFAIGRLRPGVTLEEARADLSVIAARLAAEHPVDRGISATVDPLVETRVGTLRPILVVLMSAVGLILLLASFNVANLMIARNSARRHELAIRTALGASRARLTRQLMTESLLLGLGGGALGLLLAALGTSLLSSLHPAAAAQLAATRIDAHVLAFTFGIAVITSILFAIAPAYSAAAEDLHAALKDGGRTDSGGRKRRSLRRILVTGEVALSLMLSVCAGLLIRSAGQLQHQELGFGADHILSARMYLPKLRYPDSDSITRFSDRLAERVRALPGVVDATVGDLLPPTYRWVSAFAVVGRPRPAEGSAPTANFGAVDAHYLSTLRIPLRRGRAFTASDTATSPRVVLINETLARRYFPDEDPVGKQIDVGTPGRLEPPVPGKPMPRLTIIGVMADTKNRGLALPPDPDLIGLYSQNPEQNYGFKRVTLHSSSPPSSLIASLRAEVRAIDNDLPLFEVRTMDEIVARESADNVFGSLLLTTFALLGISLTVVGVYGVAAYAFAQRRTEIAIRVALGARASQVVRLILGEVVVVGLVGIALGLAGSIAATRVAGSVLYGVSPRDPMTFASSAVLVAIVVLLATLLPCRSATRIGAVESLRSD
jgi:putative ABC transport system permease protein